MARIIARETARWRDLASWSQIPSGTARQGRFWGTDALLSSDELKSRLLAQDAPTPRSPRRQGAAARPLRSSEKADRHDARWCLGCGNAPEMLVAVILADRVHRWLEASGKTIWTQFGIPDVKRLLL